MTEMFKYTKGWLRADLEERCLSTNFKVERTGSESRSARDERMMELAAST